jgi:hypothetical protein
MSSTYFDSSLEEKAPFITATESTSTLDNLDFIVEDSGSRFNREKYISRPLLARSYWWLWLLQVALLLLSCTFFYLALRLRLQTLNYVKQFSAYSPAAPAVQYEDVKFNITTKGNRFVGAGPDVDRAWREISYDMGDQMIMPDELPVLDMPESSLKVKHPQSGAEGYRVGMEVFHQLHCINLLRRVTYRDYYEPISAEFKVGAEALKMHTGLSSRLTFSSGSANCFIDHCLEVLRLNTQCHADIGLFTFYMVEGDPLAWPELNSWHKCRNFDRVRDWAVQHSVGNMEVL